MQKGQKDRTGVVSDNIETTWCIRVRSIGMFCFSSCEGRKKLAEDVGGYEYKNNEDL